MMLNLHEDDRVVSRELFVSINEIAELMAVLVLYGHRVRMFLALARAVNKFYF